VIEALKNGAARLSLWDLSYSKSVFLKSASRVKNLPGSWIKGQKRGISQSPCLKS
jgi:hypothetical protein